MHPTCAGQDSARDRNFILYHWHAMPGVGVLERRDVFGHLISLGGLTILNLEDYEQLYPVRYLRHEPRCDAGGPGRYRGGCEVAYEVEMCDPSGSSRSCAGPRSGCEVAYEVEMCDPATFYFRSEGLGPPSI